ncbi:hypothetical protein LCGC14_2731010 [marine sediment metagenome]|uniref:Uncharacterized protein n=1 Tax=marine sediment metagenome TaxID=412755 RepID=A0A0F8Z7D8_9ZZZZ
MKNSLAKLLLWILIVMDEDVYDYHRLDSAIDSIEINKHDIDKGLDNINEHMERILHR